MPRLPLALFATLALVTSCQANARVTGARPTSRPVTTKASPSATPRPALAPAAEAAIAAAVKGLATRAVPQAGDAVRLTGKVKLISDAGGGVISDHGGGIISNNTGGLISDGGGGYRVAQVSGLAEAALAEAAVTLHDAAGRVLVDDKGEPLAAYTDGEGSYALTAVLPPGNVVMKIKLWNGGELAAIAAATTHAQDVDTGSTLGAAYVLDQYVKGKQEILDKLPATEAQRLQRDVAAAIDAAPKYEPADLVAQVARLRAKVPVLDQTLKDIQALLIGQTNLGTGRPATEVPLLSPNALAVASDGRLFVGEARFGRVREVATDGTIDVYADLQKGRVKQNFRDMTCLATGPDGSVYVARDDRDVTRIWPDGHTEHLAGAGLGSDKPLLGAAVPATRLHLQVGAMAVAADGALYLGCDAYGDTGLPAVATIGADGIAAVRFKGQLPGGDLAALAVRDGAFTYLERTQAAARLARRAADGAETVLSTAAGMRGMAMGRDGTLYVVERDARRVLAYAPAGGEPKVLAGTGGPAGRELEAPTTAAVAPDGTVYVLDEGTSLVYAMAADGAGWRIAAGTTTFSVTPGALAEIPLNGPSGVAFDPAGALLISELGTGVVKRFDGTRFVPYMTGLADPAGMIWAGEGLHVMAPGDHVLRLAGATARDLIGPGIKGSQRLEPDAAIPASAYEVTGDYLARAADGRLYLNTDAQQVVRLDADGQVRLVAGLAPAGTNEHSYRTATGTPIAPGEAAKARPLGLPYGLAFGPDGALYVAENLGWRILKIVDPGGPSPTIQPFAGIAALDFLQDPYDLTRYQDGIPATDAFMMAPMALCFDAAGNLYYSQLGTASASLLSDSFSTGVPLPEGIKPTYPAIRKIDTKGVVTTIAGEGGRWFSDPEAGDALLIPSALAIDPQGRLVIVDAGANLVRILPAGTF